MTREDERTIPDPLKRQVRQKCGFGCVICRCPIYQYAHIIPWAEVRVHEEDNLVLLCSNHHLDFDKKGNLTKAEIRDAIEKIAGGTSPWKISQQPYEVDVGANRFGILDGTVFSIEGFGEFAINDPDEYKINACFLDPDGRPAIEIKNSAYTLYDTTWDIEYIGRKLTFRNGLRDMFATLEWDAESKLITVTLKVKFPSGVTLTVKDDGIYYNSTLVATGNEIEECKYGLIVSSRPELNNTPALFSNMRLANSSLVRIRGAIAIKDPILLEKCFVSSADIALLITPDAMLRRLDSK